MADILLGGLIAIGGIFTILSVYNLYRFLMRILLPMFFEGRSEKLSHEGIVLLAKSVKNLIAAFVLSLVFVLVQYILGGLSN